jgi:putative oxidoreductase
MNYLQRLEHWGDNHHPRYLDILRIALGIFLCFKGIEFARNSTLLNEMIGTQVPFDSLLLLLLGHYVIFAHIMGGFLMALGLLTRFASAIQIPILIGAIIFVNSDLSNHFTALLLSILILCLLIYFVIIGSGRWSIDYTMEKETTEKERIKQSSLS